jgi:hypothetical protein
MTKSLHQPGHTLTEYALAISLVSVGCFVALQLLGNSISGNYHQISNGESGNAMRRMTQLDFTTPAVAATFQASQTNPGGTSSHGPLQLITTSSSGVNATSMDGIQNTAAGQSLETAYQLQALSQNVSDPSLKAAILAAANSVLKLSTSQASVEVTQGHDQTGALSTLISTGKLQNVSLTNSIHSVGTFHVEVEKAMDKIALLPTSDYTAQNQAYQLLTAVTEANDKQYRQLITDSDATNAIVYEPDVAQIRLSASEALNAGELAQNEAIQTSVQNSLTLSNGN